MPVPQKIHARLTGLAAAAAATALVVAGPVPTGTASAPAAGADGPTARAASGPPPGHPITELVGQFPLPKLQETEAHLSLSKWGYRFQAGMADNQVTITEVGRRLRFADAAARRWAHLPKTCQRRPAAVGIAASCRIPKNFSNDRMFLEVWPRLGDDTVDGSTLSAKYRMWVLVDEGDDTIHLGAGADFANGAFDDDTVTGGRGNDWIRVGTGSNVVDGGPGRDRLMGGDDRDLIRGGPGVDRLGGHGGYDVLWGEGADDIVVGGPGNDIGYREGNDRFREVESVR
ncbi:calcium-binding protein [Nocardioides dongxiaopingii]|uniref:calcium-binding protein n=1 Tax=Nocardioides dongxiaopingii TaxID=2576036 RepID=UPI0010C766F5|nr:calcium-binding protein [Nocardioides dongxiaopingii]